MVRSLVSLVMPPVVGGHFRYIRTVLRTRVPLAWAAIGFGVLGALVGFLGAGADGAATHPITALCLCAVAASIAMPRRFGPAMTLRFGVLGAVLLICAARLMDAVLAGTTGTAMGGMFSAIWGFSGVFSLEAAVTLGAFAAAAMLRKGSGRWGGVCLGVGLLMVSNTALGALFGVMFIQGDVSTFTLLGLGALSLSMVSAYVHLPVVRALFMKGDVGGQTRVMALAVLVVPMVAAGVLHLAGSGLVAIEVGVITAVTWTMLLILLRTSARHEGVLAARRRGERDIAMARRIDEVTGALNRFGMSEVVEGAWLDFKSSGRQFGMILIDLEYFRGIDATFGQDDAEAVLGRVAQTIAPQLRGADALGRWGADEFLVMLRIKDPSDVRIVASRLRRALSDPSLAFGAGLSMTPASMDAPFGLATLEDQDKVPTDAITRADAALHLAKTTDHTVAIDFTEDVPFQLEAAQSEDVVEDKKQAAA